MTKSTAHELDLGLPWAPIISLISNASFSRLHTLCHRKPQSSLLLRTSPSQFFHFNPTSKKLVPFTFNFAQAKIRQSCNGLLLLECGYPIRDYYVYNPSTGESRNLFVRRFLGLFLRFDPSESPYYKVVCLSTRNYSINCYEIDVYDSETHTWNRGEKICRNPYLPFHDGIYLKKCIYSITLDDERIVCFDIEKDMYRTPPLENLSIKRLHRGGLTMFSLSESDDRVRCIARDDVSNYSVECEITDKGCHESLKYIPEFIDLTALFSAMIYGRISLIGVTRRKGNEESLVFRFQGKIVVYRLCVGNFEELVDLSELGQCEAYNFVESLSPV